MPRPIRNLTRDARAVGMKAGGYVPTGMIRWHIGRYHVGRPCLAIAREYWHRLAKKFPRSIKRACVRAAIQEHLRNRQLYRDVMGGRIR